MNNSTKLNEGKNNNSVNLLTGATHSPIAGRLVGGGVGFGELTPE